jgi:hypothetical protein
MKSDDYDKRPLNEGKQSPGDHTPTPEEDERLRINAHDPTNAWGERVVAGEGEYPGPEALQNEAPDDMRTGGQKPESPTAEEAHELNSAHPGEYHNGTWSRES